MTKATDLLEKLKQRREDGEAIKAYWEAVLPGIGNLPESQLQGWLNRFDLHVIVAGLDAAVIKRSKLDAKSEKLSVQEAVDYASGAMREAQFESLSEEERRAWVAKAARIHEVRSAAGKRGRAKQLAEEAKAARDFAQASPDLPEVAQPLPNAYGFGSGVGSGFASGSVSALDSAAASSSQPTPAAAAPPVPRPAGEEKDNGNTNTKNQKTEKPPRLCRKCGATLSRSQNHICPTFADEVFENEDKHNTNPQTKTDTTKAKGKVRYACARCGQRPAPILGGRCDACDDFGKAKVAAAGTGFDQEDEV